MSRMTGRDRVTAAVEFKRVDRAPINHYVMPGAFWRHGQKLVDLLQHYPDDFGYVYAQIPLQPAGDDRFVFYIDEWGSQWQMLRGYSAGEVKRPALETWDHWSTYKFPSLPSQAEVEAVMARYEADPNQWYALAPMGSALFERMQFLRGSENLFVDLAEDRRELHELGERLVDWHVQRLRLYLAVGVDGFSFADDWGSQDRLLISPAMWRTFFKPLYRQIFDVIKEAGKHIFFHTDGWTVDIWDDLLELGVDVLNPQHTLMPRAILEEKIAGRVCIRTDLDRQGVLPFGSPRQVHEHVRDIVELFGRYNGGLILHGEIGPDVPFENVIAMYKAFEEFGTYL